MINQDELRKSVKLLKAYDCISSYKELAEEYLQVSYKGFLNWLNAQYNYGNDKAKLLESIVNDMLPQM